MLGRCELSAWDFGAVSIARGNNQGIEGQVFQRATPSIPVSRTSVYAAQIRYLDLQSGFRARNMPNGLG
jgi:hypothetical protein